MLHVAKAQLGLDDDAYRAMLKRAAGVDSSRRLDGVTFGWVLAELERLGWKAPAARRSFGGLRVGMVTDAQAHLIRTLWDDFTGGRGTEKGLDRWIERQFKVSALRFLPRHKAAKAIAALKEMNNRRGTTRAA